MTALWGLVVAAGLLLVWNHASAPGAPASAPAHWPTDSAIERVPGRPTLVVLAHPKCACTRATLDELARLLAHVPERVSAHVLFAQPEGVGEEWSRSDLWAQANAIAGVEAALDPGGAEAGRFGAATSGQVLLYDAAGELRFSGGITSGRGHEGDNAGRAAIRDILLAGASSASESAVFGCPLRSEDASTCSEGETGCGRPS